MWTEEHRRTYRREGEGYPSDLRDAEWARLEPLIPKASPGGRPRKTDMRAAMNAVLYLLRTGCPWRYLPHDTHHPLTIKQAVELFAELGTPRSKRSVQRFCEQEYLDCVRIKGVRGDQFFINRESVERYAEELRQIEAVAAIGDDARHDAPQHAIARNSAIERDSTPAVTREPDPVRLTADESETIKRLESENLNLRIDNRGKEVAINSLMTQVKDKDQHLQELIYRLGAAESRLAQLEAPKAGGDAARHTATEPDDARHIEAIIMPAPTPAEPASIDPEPLEPRRSFLDRLFR